MWTENQFNHFSRNVYLVKNILEATAADEKNCQVVRENPDNDAAKRRERCVWHW